MYIYVSSTYVSMFSFLLGKYIGVGLLGQMVAVYINSYEICTLPKYCTNFPPHCQLRRLLDAPHPC